MGCGAMCGDNVLISTSNKKSKIAFQKILVQLQKNDKYSKSQTFKVFHECYVQKPQNFYLKVQQKLASNQQLPQQILLKWKVVLFGQDNNKSAYVNCLGLHQHVDNHSNQTQTGNFNNESPLFFHECFKQIQKDLDRTFTLPQLRKQSFEKILKKIANYFPKMGYTQGINFMIGYLIIIGYSEQDSFWMFVHIALNRRFLFLGLYEDGFPLVNVLIQIFNNMLKRQNQNIYNHLIVELGIDTSQWIFKWFITCYLYSFPRQLIKYIWDFIIHIGNLGMISFAIALVKELDTQLLGITEIADISQFFDSLKDINQFNQHINLKRVIQCAYAMNFTQTDFEGVQETGGFYGVYLKESFFFQAKDNQKFEKKQNQKTLKQQKTESLINQWYEGILKERQIFINKFKQISANEDLKVLNFNQTITKSKIIQELGENEEILSIQFNIQFPNSIKRTQFHSFQPQDIKNNAVKKGSYNDFQQNRIQYVVENINENIEQEQNSIKSSISTNKDIKKQQIIQNIINMDQLAKLEYQFSKKNITNITKSNNYATNSKINKQIKNNKLNNQTKPPFDGTKINNYANSTNNSLSIAGQNLLKIQKMDNSFDAISVSSKHATNRSKKQNSKNNNQSPAYLQSSVSNKICSCKIRTEEHKKQIGDHNSQLSQSKDHFSEKDSNKNEQSHRQKSVNQNYSIHNMQIDRIRKSINEDYMINSHGPQILQKKSSVQNLEKKQQKHQNEVQLQFITFKKDKRNIQPNIPYPQANKNRIIQKNSGIGWQNEQQSIQSINHICYDKMSNGTSRRSHTGNNYEVQSIR